MLHPVVPFIAVDWTGFPSVFSEQVWIFELVDFHAQRIALWFQIFVSAGDADISLGTRRGADQQIDFGQKLDIVPHIDGGGFCKVLVGVLGESRAHEDIQDIVDV